MPPHSFALFHIFRIAAENSLSSLADDIAISLVEIAMCLNMQTEKLVAKRRNMFDAAIK